MPITDFTDFLGLTQTKKNRPIGAGSLDVDVKALGPKKILLSWEARPRKVVTTIDPKLKKTLTIIGIAVGLLFVAMGELMLILVVFSAFFITQAIARTPMQTFNYEISTHGISISGQFYYWNELTRFFFSSAFGAEVLSVDTREGLPGRLIITFVKKDKKKLIEILNTHLPYFEEEPLNFVDKAYTGILDKFDFQRK